MVGSRNTLYPCRVIPFVYLADSKLIRVLAFLNMKRIWNHSKVWILISLAYAGFYFFKVYKIFKQIFLSRSLLTKES
jgi:hypothetical protein